MNFEDISASGAGNGSAGVWEAGAFCRADSVHMAPTTITPDWIRCGEPVSRCAELLISVDRFAWTAIWDCTRGTFEWHYELDETVCILEGEVRVTDAHGQVHTLTAGSIGYFPANTTWLWEVDDYVRKVAFCRRTVPFGLRLIARVLGKLNIDGWLLRCLRPTGGAAPAWSRGR